MSNTETIITARAKAFSSEGVRDHKMTVDNDGTVRVLDSVAGHYTTCHAMSERTCQRIRRIADAHAIPAMG